MRPALITAFGILVVLTGVPSGSTSRVFAVSREDQGSRAGAATNLSPKHGAEAASPTAPQVRRYSLEVVLNPARHQFSGTAKLELVGVGAAKPLALLLNGRFNVTSVREGEKPVAFSRGPAEREAKPLLVQLTDTSGGLNSRVISIAYQGTIPPPGPQDPDWMGALVIRTNEIRMTEQSRWYPMLAGARAPIEASIKLPEAFALVWPGASHKTRDGSGQATWQVAVTDPAAPALLAGIYETVGRFPVAVCLFPESAAAARTILEQAGNILTFFESRFGPPPFQPLAVCEMRVLNRRFSYNFAGPGGVVFPTELIRLAQRPERQEFWTRKLAHELAHQWWGCGVDLPHEPWPLHESLAEFSAALYLQSLHPDKSLSALLADEDLEQIRQLSALARRGVAPSDREYRQCLGYRKGPRVLAMLREMVGAEPFDRALRVFYSQHRFRAATREQFQGSFGDGGVIPVRTFFEQWIDRRLLPQLKVEAVPPSESGGSVVLRFEQAEPAFLLPVEVRLTSAAGTTVMGCLITQGQKEIKTQIPGPLLYFEVDPFGKLLLEAQPDMSSLIQALLQAKTAYQGLLAAHQASQPERLNTHAQELRDVFRRFSTALEIERHRQRLAARGPLDAKTAWQLDQYQALKATLEGFFSREGQPADLGRSLRNLAEAADEIHDALREKKPENIAPAITQLAETWDQLSRMARSQAVLE